MRTLFVIQLAIKIEQEQIQTRFNHFKIKMYTKQQD